MIKYSNECVNCDIPCKGSRCSKRNVARLYCDVCGSEVNKLYSLSDVDACANCTLDILKDDKDLLLDLAEQQFGIVTLDMLQEED